MTKKLITYTLLIPNRKPISVTYRNGIQSCLDFGANVLTAEGVEALWSVIPLHEPKPEVLTRAFAEKYNLGVVVIVSEIDTSFEAFWERYNFKVGTKTRAEKHWASLSKTDRIAAIEWIAVYDAERPTYQAKLHPESYIISKRYKP
jgi:hypothetical protein